VKLLKAFKFRLKPDDGEIVAFSRFAGCSRLVWNKALSLQKTRLHAGQRMLSYESMASELLFWKKDFPFLQEVHSQPLQQRLMELDRALKEAFDKKNPKRFPIFKKKYKSVSSFRYPQGFKVSGNCVYLPKIGWVPFYKSQDITGTPKNCTVSEHGGHWYVSIQTEAEVPDPVHRHHRRSESIWA
jgi:putative transposase